MRTRAEQVRRLLDQMVDGHSDILAEFVKFNTNERQDSNHSRRLANQSLVKAASLLREQAQRMHNLAWELDRL